MGESFSFIQGSGLFNDPRFSFARPVPTVDPLGTRVAPGEPRFGYGAALAGLPPDYEVIDANLPASSLLHHAGVDRDALTTVAVGYVPSTRLVKVYREAFGQGSSTMQLLRTLALPSDAGFGAGDLMRAIFPGCPVGSIAHDPANMMVVHGTLLALCRVIQKIAPNQWQIKGVAMLYSLDLGKSWTKYWTDIDAPRDIGRWRLSGWEMTNYYTPYVTDGKPPLEVVVPFSDYRLGGIPNPAKGGRICWFKMVRKNRTAPLEPLWGPGGQQASDHRMAVFTLDTNPADDRYCHVHAAGVAEWTRPDGGQGWQIIAGIGDGAASSILRILVRDVSTYWQPQLAGGGSNWAVQANFHGHADTAVLDPVTVGPGTGEHQNFDTATGMQFVGCGPGPTPGTLIVASDAVGEGILLLTPGDSIESRPQFQTLFCDLGSVPKSNCFFARVDRPERVQRTVTCGMRLSPYASTHQVRGPLDVICYSTQSGVPGSWGAIAYDRFEQQYALVGSYVYATLFGGSKFVRFKLPPLKFGRPLQVGPGGRQWLRDDPTTLNVSGMQVLRCPRDESGRWMYPTADGTGTLGVITPQPPVMVDAVYRIRKKIEDTNGGLIMTISGSQTNPRTGSQLLESAELSAWPNTDPVDYVRPMWLRLFVRNTPTTLDLAPYEQGRSSSSLDLSIAYEGVPASLGDRFMLATDRWQAVQASFESRVGTGEWFSLIARSRTRSTDVDAIVAVSEFLSENYQGPGYPLPPDIPECLPEPSPDFPGWGCFPKPTDFTDELASVSGLSLGGSWTLLIAGLCPEDSWDQYTVIDPTDMQHALFSLLTADPDGPRITVRAMTRADAGETGLVLGYQGSPSRTELRKLAGSASFFRNRPVLIALTGNAASGILTMTAAVAGNLLPKQIAQTPIVASTFSSLLLSGPEGQGTVSSFQWIGFRTEARVLSDTEILGRFQTLDFL